MTTSASTNLQRLLAWLSPAFPVGAFAFSSGLETAIKQKAVRDAATAADWLRGQIEHGNAATDAILLGHAHAHNADPLEVCELANLSLALCPSSLRTTELKAVGRAFLAAARAWPHPVYDSLPGDCSYPVALGAVAGAHDLALRDTLTAFFLTYCQAQISVAIRLIPLGQTDGLKVLAGLEPDIDRAVTRAMTSSLDDLGAIGYAADIAAMAHETLETRIFRS